ncbi:MAG: hypothetical protein K940chlam8_00442 [Chlamydiae bacterium]|nr:hypothetical protein [Chlamydiota bacterium]
MTNVGPVSFRSSALPLEKRRDALDALTQLINKVVTYTLIKGSNSYTHALAFLIEHMSQKEVEGLHQSISECKLDKTEKRAWIIRTNTAKLTWMIQEKVFIVYNAYLAQLISQFDRDKDFLQKILALKEKSSFKDKHQKLKNVYEKGIIPGFGICSKDYLPQWYLRS